MGMGGSRAGTMLLGLLLMARVSRCAVRDVLRNGRAVVLVERCVAARLICSVGVLFTFTCK